MTIVTCARCGGPVTRVKGPQSDGSIIGHCHTCWSKVYCNLTPLRLAVPKVKARPPFLDEKPDGLQISLNDWIEENKDAVEWFLTHYEAKLREA